MVPQDAVELVRRWARDKTPEEFRDRMLVELEESERSLTVFECSLMPDLDGGMHWLRVPNARLLYAKGRNEWTLYFIDGNDRARRYPGLRPSSEIQDLLDEIDDDPRCIFWG